MSGFPLSLWEGSKFGKKAEGSTSESKAASREKDRLPQIKGKKCQKIQVVIVQNLSHKVTQMKSFLLQEES